MGHIDLHNRVANIAGAIELSFFSSLRFLVILRRA
jgi:hypothetical protein